MVNDVVVIAAGDRGEVGHAIGVQREEVRDAVGSRDTDGRLTDQLAGIAARLLGAVHEVADQLQTRRTEDLPKRDRSGVTRADVCYPIPAAHSPGS